MKVTIIEGTPEEIRSALPDLSSSALVLAKPLASGGQAQTAPAPESNDPDENAAVDERVARKVLNRRPLSVEQTKVLKLIYKAGTVGILGTEIQTSIGWKRAQFTGLMGAFGNRIVNTPGYHSGDWFFDQKWDYDEASFRYRLPETVRAAMRAEGIA